MAIETVLISVVAATAGAARVAVEQLRAAGVKLGEPELGHRGEWLAYGPLLVEVEHAAPPPPPPAPPPVPPRRRPRRR
jgi:hypothetical protein